MCLSGKLYGAAEAHAWGLVDRLVPAEELLPTALALAGEIAQNPDPQLRMIKELLSRNGSATDLGAVQRLETDMLIRCWASPEHHEAVQAFLEKRPPRFR
jgi:enoyl-CoA hydratase/carnithine racemase